VVYAYTYTMRVRTQVMLEAEQYEYLVGEAERTGLSRSELVRRALDETFRPEARFRVGGFDIGFGMWRSPDSAIAGRRVGPR
jgi:Ribbon-helix-helix protein, copG family